MVIKEGEITCHMRTVASNPNLSCVSGDWTFVAELQSPNLPPVHIKKMDHLVCFLGGMIALGAVTDPAQDQERIRYHLEVRLFS